MSNFRFNFKNEKHRQKWFRQFAKSASNACVAAYLLSPLSGADVTLLEAKAAQDMTEDEFYLWACEKAGVKPLMKGQG